MDDTRDLELRRRQPRDVPGDAGAEGDSADGLEVRIVAVLHAITGEDIAKGDAREIDYGAGDDLEAVGIAVETIVVDPVVVIAKVIGGANESLVLGHNFVPGAKRKFGLVAVAVVIV